MDLKAIKTELYFQVVTFIIKICNFTIGVYYESDFDICFK